ncbi:hypothetical protein FB451DRAFT_1394574 [Mycena latifolia]|nr:hypothetical protein FB451DRAFT_1394574 [Mycena latifolia]
MPSSRWTTAAQLAFLNLQLPDYVRRQAQKKLSLFWGPMEEGWFYEFPEQAVLGLPLPQQPGSDLITPEQREALGAAIKKRKEQLASWFRREAKKIRQGPGAAPRKTLTPLTIALMKKTRPTGQRAHKPVEIFQKRNKDKIRIQLTQRGFDSMNEAARADAQGSSKAEETLEVQEAHVRLSRSERMCLRAGVVSELWANASEEERETVRIEVEREREAIRKRQREEELMVREDQPAKTPEQLQLGIDCLDGMFGEAQHVADIAAGWASVTLLGRPTPRQGGALTVKVICAGETAQGNTFRYACPNFKEEIVERFQTFLQQVYPFSVRDERALPAAETVPSTPPLAPSSDSDSSESEEERSDVPVVKPRKKTAPRRIPKPKKKAGTQATPSSPAISPPASSPSLSSPSAPPASPVASPFASPTPPTPAVESSRMRTASPPPSDSVCLPVVPTSEWTFPASGVVPVIAPDAFGLGAGAGGGETGDWDALRVSLSTDLEPPAAFSGDEPFNGGDIFSGGTEDWWSSQEAHDWGKALGTATSPFATPAGHSTFHPLSASSLSPADDLPPLSLQARPIPRPSYRGSAFYDTNPQAERAEGSIFKPSALFRAFDGSRSRTPFSPSGSPASLRRKATAWNSPAHRGGLPSGGSPLRTTDGFASHTARAMASIVGAPAPRAGLGELGTRKAPLPEKVRVGAGNGGMVKGSDYDDLPALRPAAKKPVVGKRGAGKRAGRPSVSATAVSDDEGEQEDDDAAAATTDDLHTSRRAARKPAAPGRRRNTTAPPPPNPAGASEAPAPDVAKRPRGRPPKPKGPEPAPAASTAGASIAPPPDVTVAKKPRGRPPKPKGPEPAATSTAAGAASSAAGATSTGTGAVSAGAGAVSAAAVGAEVVGGTLEDTTNQPEVHQGRVRKAKRMVDGTIAPQLTKGVRPAKKPQGGDQGAAVAMSKKRQAAGDAAGSKPAKKAWTKT